MKLNEKTKINIIRYGGSLLLTLLFGAVLILFQNESPLKAVQALFEGSFGSIVGFCNVLHWMASCSLVGLAGAVAFKSGVMNLGIEGQLYIGAWVAGLLGYKLALPGVIHPMVCIIVAGIAGMLWGLLPALLKLVFQINEIITTLMMNFIAKLFTEYLTLLVLESEGTMNITTIKLQKISESAHLSVLVPGTSATTAVFIAIGLSLLMYLLYKYTIKGYELKQVGQNLRFSKIGGVNAARTFVSIFMLTSFIGGIAGAVEILGVNHQFITKFSANMGWDGIMIARIAANNPISVILVSFLWSIFKTGSLNLERATLLNRYVINLLQALLVVFLSIDYKMLYDRFKQYKLRKKLAKRLQGGES